MPYGLFPLAVGARPSSSDDKVASGFFAGSLLAFSGSVSVLFGWTLGDVSFDSPADFAFEALVLLAELLAFGFVPVLDLTGLFDFDSVDFVTSSDAFGLASSDAFGLALEGSAPVASIATLDSRTRNPFIVQDTPDRRYCNG